MVATTREQGKRTPAGGPPIPTANASLFFTYDEATHLLTPPTSSICVWRVVFDRRRCLVDAVQAERMRAGLEEAQRRHVRALVAAVACATMGRVRAAEAKLDRARCHNSELEEKLRQISAEGQAWMGVAKSHEAVAAGLRATLD